MVAAIQAVHYVRTPTARTLQRTKDNAEDGEASAVRLRLVHEVEAGGQHDAARDGVRHGGPLLGQHAHKEERHLERMLKRASA